MGDAYFDGACLQFDAHSTSVVGINSLNKSKVDW